MNIRHGLVNALFALLAAPQFNVLSQASDRETSKWIRDFQQFIVQLHDFAVLLAHPAVTAQLRNLVDTTRRNFRK
jgi:hypothetical protein